MSESSSIPGRGVASAMILRFFVLTCAAVFLALHASHLSADFPNHSPWEDWSKFTDEGWYGDAAIRHTLRGQWYVPGDFNPGAALPVWPLLEAMLFHFTGVSLTAARALTVATFALILVCSYLLVRRWQRVTDGANRAGNRSFAAETAVLLLAVSPFCYAFTRMAILEPLLILLMLLALLAASYARTPAAGDSPMSLAANLRHTVPIVIIGILLPLMVLTKTTAIFLFPSIAWLLWARSGYRFRTFLRMTLPAAALGFAIWLAYYGLIVRPHFLGDYQYLFVANTRSSMTPSIAVWAFHETVTHGQWIGILFYPLTITTVLFAVLLVPRLFANPLIPSLMLWTAGYGAYIAYRINFQPRYYLVIAIPLILLLPVIFETVWTRSKPVSPLGYLAATIFATLLAMVVVTDACQTLRYIRNPEYSFIHAASHIHDIIAADRTHSPLILSVSGADLSLMTGLPSICDEFGTMALADRIRAYYPGWYVAWNDEKENRMEVLTPLYHLQRVASFPVMDDPRRNRLILYRLDPVTSTPREPQASTSTSQTVSDQTWPTIQPQPN